jgi:CheY-like chemotaxis protein
VEDHEFGREAVRVLLELNGHEVREADDGPRGLMLAISWQPDVVCLDLVLPSMSGYDVATAIVAAFEPTRRPLLIALTACTLPAEQERAMACGFDAYLVKPFEAAALEGLIASRHPRGPANEGAGG